MPQTTNQNTPELLTTPDPAAPDPAAPAWSAFLTIAKVDTEQRIVEGFATIESPDGQAGIWDGQIYDGDIVDTEAIKAALPDYMEWANLREMHQNSAVGIVLRAELIEGEVEVDGKTYHNPLKIIAKVVDSDAWDKVKTGVYKGFSIGGKVIRAMLEKSVGRVLRRVTRLKLNEISLVDRPAHPDAKILLWKMDYERSHDMTKPQITPQETPASAPKADPQAQPAPDTALNKAAGDPQKIIGNLQSLRNECELAGDLDGAALYTQAIALVLQAGGQIGEAAETEAAEVEAAETPEVEPEVVPGEEPLAMAQRSGPLRKAGRTFKSSNATMMHSVIKTLADMLSTAGDEVAMKVAACYGGTEKQEGQTEEQPEEGLTEEKMAKVAGDALSKVLQPAVDALTQTFTQKFEGIDTRLAAIEAQPAAGGPVLRPIEKVIAGQKPNDPPQQPANPPTVAISELRRLAATEPDPIRKTEYNRQLIIAEQRLASRAH